MIDQTYTLAAAKLELALQECRAHGHDLDVEQIRLESGRVAPVTIQCSRCGESWAVQSGTL